MGGYISGLADQLRIASDAPYEYSEPMTAIAAGGQTTLRSPYNATNVQWRCDIASSDTSEGIIIIGDSSSLAVPSETSQLTPLRGLYIYVPAKSSIPVRSCWYDLMNVESLLYFSFNFASGNGYASVQFRRKR